MDFTSGVQRATSSSMKRLNFSDRPVGQRNDRLVDERLLIGLVGHRDAVSFGDLGDDRRRRAAWSKQRQHLLGDEALHSGFDGSRYLRRHRQPRPIGDRKQAQFASAMKFEHLAGHGRDDHRNLSGDHVGKRGTGTAVRHVRQVLDAGQRFEQFAAQVVHRSRAG